jgi:protein-disulfide isomerase
MVSIRTICALAAAAWIGVAAFAEAEAAEFSDAQHKEIIAVVKDYLIKNPEILRELMQELEKRDELAQAEQAKAGIAQNAEQIFRSKADFIAGNPKAAVTVVEFFDYNCGFCKRAVPDVLALIDGDKDLKVVLKEFPILGPGSVFASKAAIASKKQGRYWDFHLALLRARDSLNEDAVLRIAKDVGLDVDRLKRDVTAADVVETIDGNARLARAIGIEGTPAFLIGERLLPGAVGLPALRKELAALREAGGCKVC